MFRKQSFWKGSALLLASAMTAKLLGACFKIPLTNVLGGTGTGAAAQPVHVSAGGAVCHADRRPASCPVLSACHCTGGTVRLSDCRGTGLLGGLAEHDPHGVVAGTGSGGEAGLRTGTVHVGAPESGGRLPLGAAGGAAFGTGCRGSRAGCHAVYSAGVGVLSAARSAAGYPTAPR